MMTVFTPGSPGFLLLCLGLLILLINGWTFVTFWLDKRRAVAGEWRVPEATLLLLALMGGWVGAKLAQRRFRHKTRKQPFTAMLNWIGAVHLLVAVATGLVIFAGDRVLNMEFSQIAVLFESGDSAGSTKPMPTRFGPGSADW